MQTRYERRPTTGSTLTGTKRFITGAGISHGYIVFATRDPTMRTKGISAFLVMQDDPGVSFGQGRAQDGHPRLAHARGVPRRTREIPADRLIGEEGRGFAYAMQTLDYSRPDHRGAGARHRAGRVRLRGAVRDRAPAVRQADQRSSRASSFMLADMAMEIEAGRACSCTARWPRATRATRDDLLRLDREVLRRRTRPWRSPPTRCRSSGGYGYMREYPVERFMRDAKITQIYEGTNQIQRVVIARELAEGHHGLRIGFQDFWRWHQAYSAS